MVRTSTFVVICLSVALGSTAPASGSNRLPSDPDADTPSGTVYQLPLDSARRDAAPRYEQPSGGSGEASPDAVPEAVPPPDSPIRSENHFGSSSSVPGVGTGSSPAKQRPGGSVDGSADDAVSEVKSATLAPTSAQVGSGPSRGMVISLAALIVLVGAGLGIAVGRSRRQPV